jgi:hypothetical protein
MPNPAANPIQFHLLYLTPSPVPRPFRGEAFLMECGALFALSFEGPPLFRSQAPPINTNLSSPVRSEQRRRVLQARSEAVKKARDYTKLLDRRDVEVADVDEVAG